MERMLHEERLALRKSVHNTVCKKIAESGTEPLTASQTMYISEGVEMAALCAFRGREEVRQENYVVFGISGICYLAAYRRRESSMPALAEVVASDRLLVRSEKLVERPAHELQEEQVSDTAMRKDLYLELHGE